MDKIRISSTETQQVTSDDLDIIAHDYLEVPLELDDNTTGSADVDLGGTVINVTDGVYTDTKEAVEAKDATVTGTECQRIKDPNILSVLLSNITHSLDGKLTKSEVEAVTSMSGWFYNNTNIVNFDELPNFVNLISFANNVFQGCTNLKHILLTNISVVGENCFRSDSKLEYIEFGKNITKIQTQAFCSSMPNLSKVVFYDLASFLNVTYSDAYNPLFMSQGHLYFSNDLNNEITSIVIPEDITVLKKSVLCGCKYLTSLTLHSNMTAIEAEAVRNCTSLKSIAIPSSVTSIGSDAFYNCSSLTSINIPSSVTSIGAGAFYNCSSWVGEVAIPNGQTSVGTGTFYNCKGLTKITIPNTVTSIGQNAFQNCNLGEISFGDNFNSVSTSSFNNAGITGVLDLSNTKIVSLSTSTFANNTGITEIKFPSTFLHNGQNTFNNCTGLTKVTYQSVEQLCKIDHYTPFSNTNPLYYAHHIYIASDPDNELTVLNVPEGITAINWVAFINATGLTEVNLPSTLTSIGSNAFQGCSGLTSIVIPEKVTTLPYYSFALCGLMSITFNNITTIGQNALQSCKFTSLDLTTAPSLKTIGSGAFASNNSLKSIIRPNTLTSIGGDFLYNCKVLSSIEYKGTCEQFKSLVSTNRIGTNLQTTSVVCSDGTVTLNSSGYIVS